MWWGARSSLDNQSMDESRPLRVSYATYTRAGLDIEGKPKPNQDAHVSFTFRDAYVAVLGVFDGHGVMGRTIARMCARLLEELAEGVVGPSLAALRRKGWVAEASGHTATNLDEVREAIHTLFDAIQSAVSVSVDASISGTTMAVAFIVGSHLIVASVGDSLAYIGRLTRGRSCSIRVLNVSEDAPMWSAGWHIAWFGDGANVIEFHRLTVRHAVSSPTEMVRVTQSGGIVRQSRVCAPGMSIGMTRCIGDRVFSPDVILHKPHVRYAELDMSDATLILATDGVWDVMRPARAFEHAEFFKPDVGKMATSIGRESRRNWANLKLGRVDDITVMVAHITRVA